MPTFYKWGTGLGGPGIEVARAEDEFLVTTEGDRIIDAAAGAAVANLGHSVPGIADAMADQADRLGYVSTTYYTAEPIGRLTEALEAITPADLNTVFYVNSGSEANESAFKLARAYHVARGKPEKTRIVARWQSYHGSTLGALAATGTPARRRAYQPLLVDWPHVPPANPYRWDYRGTPAEQGVACARELEALIRREGPETIGAFIAEPVSGSSLAAAHPHPAYFAEIRRICDAYDVLFIADEVMTGFGRTGAMFAVDGFDVTPDLLTVGKGLSAGYAPISALVIEDGVAETVEDAADVSFSHGHTFSANPISAATAAHVVSRYTDDLLARVGQVGDRLVAALAPARERSIVGDVRAAGLLVGIEFVRNPETKVPFDPSLKVHKQLFREALSRGVYTYPGGGTADGVAGDHLLLAPPLTTSADSIDRIAATVVDAIDAIAAELARDGDIEG